MNARQTVWLTPGLAVAGVLVGGYLTVVHYRTDALVCGVGDCLTVQSSSYAKIAGIPIAILGLVMYLALLGLSLLRARMLERDGMVSLSLFFVSLTGVIYSLYLTYVEVWVINAICQWCVLSAIITAVIFFIETRVMWLADRDSS